MTLLLAAALSHCGGRRQPEVRPVPAVHEGRPVVPSERTASSLQIEEAAPAAASSSRSLVARVAFNERRLALIGAPVQGRVADVRVVTGDRVREGEVLATIHAPDVAAANAQVLETHAATVLAESNARRAQSLVTEGAGSVAEQQQAEAALVQAHSEAARAIAARNALGGVHGLSDYELHSPIAGEVVERSVTVGSEVHVGQDQPLITVADLSTVWVLADVFEQDLPLIHVGDEASIDVVAFPGRRFTGRITYVSDTIDPQTRAARARIEIPNPDGALRPGMFAHVEAHGQVEGSAEVPMSAVLARRDQYFVFVHNPDGTFVQREVQLGEQHGQHVTILSGLRPGEPVVTDGAILLDAEANTAL